MTESRDVTAAARIEIDGTTLPALWLRDACACGLCRDPGTGQRTDGGPGRLDPATAVSEYEIAGDQLTVVFAPDGHTARFALGSLGAQASGRLPLADPTLWTRDALPAGPPTASWDDYRSTPEGLAAALEAVADLGAVRLVGLPPTPGTVLAAARRFGFVRTTNYGELFDVRVEPDPVNLAYTDDGLAPHTDNPYRDPVPGIQLLHCLRAAGAGGDTVLVDGFAVARRLRERDPAAFATLSTVWLPFRYDSAAASLAARAPVITLDPDGAVTQVRWNDRSVGPLPLETVGSGDVYGALRAFDELLREPELRLSFRLRPGDCLIFDNTRVLHGRTSFTAAGASGSRHLQGCYADADGLLSTLRLLRRAQLADQPAGQGSQPVGRRLARS